MIVYGTRAPHLRTEPLPGYLVCPHCHTAGAMRASVFGRYVHVYYIPFVPAGKMLAVECQHCGTVWEGDKIPAEALPAARDVQARASRSHTDWTGAALVVAGIVGASVFAALDGHQNRTFLAAPLPGDVYTVYDDSTKNYSLLRVMSTGGNVVELVANDYQTDNTTPIKTLDQDTCYSGQPFSLTRFDLQIMEKKGELTDVDRRVEE